MTRRSPSSWSARDAVVTGIGAVSPIGTGVGEFTAGLREGRSGITRLGFADPHMKSTVAAECRGFDATTVLDEGELARVPRLVPLGLAAAREAMDRAGLPHGAAMPVEASRRVGLILGTGGGGIDFTLHQAEKVHHGGKASLWTITNATHGNLAGELSIALGLHGPSLCTSTGCASSSDALGLALSMLRVPRNEVLPDTWVVVGADAHVYWGVLYTMELLRVISMRDFSQCPELAPTASRPFDRSRDGFVLGEGAWAVVVEREETVRARSERAGRNLELARVRGYGCTCDAYHRVRPSPDMADAARAMRQSIDDAGLTPRQIEVLQYHGTSTQMNDALETVAVKMVFGEHAARLPGSSIKSMIGHPQGASGMAGVVGTLCALRGEDGGAPFIMPTINLREPDPACDLDYTPNAAAATEAKVALVNCLAFGAKNSALVVEAGIG